MMQIPLGLFELRLRLGPVLAYVPLCALLLWLGFWQLGRYEQKQALNAEQAGQQALAHLPLSEALVAGEAASLRRVTAQGVLSQDYVFLHDNRVLQGRAGYDVLALLRPASDLASAAGPSPAQSPAWVLVNLGWVLADVDRSQLPVVSLPTEPVELSGVWSFPSKGVSLKSTTESMQLGWPKVIQDIDYPALRTALDNAALHTGVLQAKTASFPLYTARWQPVASDPRKNLSYAVQWFGMALALTFLALKVALRRRVAA